MRLSTEQIQSITQTVFCLAGKGAEVYLFGSRLNDQTKGGDVDLFIETGIPMTLKQRVQIKLALESQLQLPVDIVAQTRHTTPNPFQIIARENAVRLEAHE